MNIIVQKVERTIRVDVVTRNIIIKRPINNIQVNQVGRRGPQGEAGAPGVVQSVVGGTNVTVDSTDPANPIVSATGGGGGGAVDSVNGQTGVVVLDASDVGADPAGSAADALSDANDYTDDEIAAINYPVDSVNGQTDTVVLDTDDITDTATHRYTNDTAISKLAGIQAGAEVNVNADWNAVSGDAQILNKPSIPDTSDLFNKLTDDTDDITVGATNKFATAAEKTKLGNITITQPVDLDTLESDVSSHIANVSNPHSVTKAQVGLGNADNTSDANKPVSTATQTALNLKANLASPTFTGTPTAPTQTQGDNSTKLSTTAYVDTAIAAVEGSDVDSFNGRTGTVVPVAGDYTATMTTNTPAGGIAATNVQTAINELDTEKEPTITGTTSADYYRGDKTFQPLNKAAVGLGNVDNTSDVNKPVSTLQQTAIDAKVADAINDGTTTIAPSQNAVFDALALKQPLDSDLTTIAGLTATTDNIMQAKAGAWASRTPAQLLADLAGVGTTFQPLDSDLTTIAGLTATTDNFMVATASAWASRTPTQARSQMGLGSLATLSTVTLTSDVTGILPGANGGTNNGFMAFTGPATTLKTFTLPNATSTILTSNAAVTVAQGGTGRATGTTAYGIVAVGTAATTAQQTIAPGTSGQFLKSAGASALGGFANIAESDVTNLVSDLAAKGDASTNTSTSVDGEAVLFSGTTGKLLKRSTLTGILKGTSGVTSVAVAGDFPTLNQNTTGSAATLTTPRAIYGNNFDGSAALTAIIASTYGGTGNGFTKFTGPATTEKTFTLPNASAVILTDASAVTVAQGGTGSGTAGGARTNLGLVIGTDVAAPNQDTTGKSAKTDALNSATTVVNVSSATAPTSGQVLTATSSTAATWQTPGGGSGTVTSVSVVSANGFAGSVATSTTTPAITIQTSVTGLLKGNGTAISAASAGTDYEVPITFSTGLTRSTNTVTVNTTQNIAKLSNLTSNGFVITSGGDGTLSVDTNTYLTTGSAASTYQPLDSTLTSLAAYNTNGIIVQTAADTFTGRSITGTLGQITVTNGNGVSGNPTLSLSSVVLTESSTSTVTNKRMTNRAPAVAQSATPAINTDVTDVAHITGLAQAITSMTTNLTGTPVEGDELRIDITDNGTLRAITWGASFENGAATLPTTTVASTRLDVKFYWNTVTSKWRCMATG